MTVVRSEIVGEYGCYLGIMIEILYHVCGMDQIIQNREPANEMHYLSPYWNQESPRFG